MAALQGLAEIVITEKRASQARIDEHINRLVPTQELTLLGFLVHQDKSKVICAQLEGENAAALGVSALAFDKQPTWATLLHSLATRARRDIIDKF